MTPRQIFDMPPVWLGGFALLAWLQAQYLPYGDFGLWGDRLGAAMVVGGLAAMGAALAEFRRHRTTVIPHQEARALISTGIYRLSRNPIYLADALILAGLCLRWDAGMGVMLVPAFMAVIQWRFIHPEEAGLRAGFGPEFAAWAARTRRWI